MFANRQVSTSREGYELPGYDWKLFLKKAEPMGGAGFEKVK